MKPGIYCITFRPFNEVWSCYPDYSNNSERINEVLRVKDANNLICEYGVLVDSISPISAFVRGSNMIIEKIGIQ